MQDDPIYRLNLHEVHTIEEGPTGPIDVMAVHGGFIYAFRGAGFGVFVPYDRTRGRSAGGRER